MKLPAFKLLSPEQDRILNLKLEGSYIIIGPPGSGKTVIALYRAQMLHKKNEPSVLLMYNNTLKSYVTAAAQDLGIQAEVIGYNRWMSRSYMDWFQAKPPMVGDFDFDWARILARVNGNPPPRGSLPYLIVDEGQDLPPMFYQLARYLAKNLTVLADGNQVLYENKNSTLQEIRDNALITTPIETLTRNYRNSRQIAELAAEFHSGIETGIPELPDRSGPPIVLRRHFAKEQSVRSIRLFWESNKKADIGVLLPTQKAVKSFVYRLNAAGVENVQFYYRDGRRLIDTLDFTKPAVRIITYWVAKGLEFDAVFLPELQLYRGDPNGGSTQMLFYVLLSRARDYLFLYYEGEETPFVSLIKARLAKLTHNVDDDFDAKLG